MASQILDQFRMLRYWHPLPLLRPGSGPLPGGEHRLGERDPIGLRNRAVERERDDEGRLVIAQVVLRDSVASDHAPTYGGAHNCQRRRGDSHVTQLGSQESRLTGEGRRSGSRTFARTRSERPARRISGDNAQGVWSIHLALWLHRSARSGWRHDRRQRHRGNDWRVHPGGYRLAIRCPLHLLNTSKLHGVASGRSGGGHAVQPFRTRCSARCPGWMRAGAACTDREGS